MTDLARLARAVQYASDCHAKHRRKYSGDPYINHPLRVMAQVAEFYPDAPVEWLEAAVLHDTIEDSDYPATVEEVVRHHSPVTCDLVLELTKKPVEGNRATRKAAETERLKTISVAASLIKLCDIMDNIGDLDWHRDADFAELFVTEKLPILEFWAIGSDPRVSKLATNVLGYAIALLKTRS